MQLLDRLRDKLEKESISVLKMSNETGISAYKIYKWLDGKGNPKHEDAKKLELWLNPKVEEIPNTGNKPDVTVGFIAEGPQDASYLKEYIASLKAHNEFLQDLVKSNLTGISDTQRIILAQVKAGLQYDARKLSAGNKKKEAEALQELNTLVAANLLGVQPKDSKVDQHM